MSDINIAILGFGFMGKVYAYAADSVKHYYPNAPKINISNVLLSKNKDKDLIKKRYQFQNVTTDYSEIINDENINAIYVALPNDLHLTHVIPAINANKSVLCEKPLEINFEKSAKMTRIAEENQSIVANAVFEYRFLPAISMIKSLINQNKLGRILQFRMMYLHGSYAEKRPMSWRLSPGIGGALLDLGPHVIDLAHYLIGPLKNIEGKISTKYSDREVDDIAQILCETESGGSGYVEVSRLSVGSVDDLRVEIHGEKGSVKWNLESMNFIDFFSKDYTPTGYQRIPVFTNSMDETDFPPEKVSSGWLMPHVHCLYNFVKKVENRDYVDNHSASFSDGLNVQKIIHSIMNKH